MGMTQTEGDSRDEIKMDVMKKVVTVKFSRERSRELRARLLDTGERELIRGNCRDDRFWGKVNGSGSPEP